MMSKFERRNFNIDSTINYKSGKKSILSALLGLFSKPKVVSKIEEAKPRKTSILEEKNRIVFNGVNIENAYLIILALLEKRNINYDSVHLKVDNVSSDIRNESLVYGGLPIFNATLAAQDNILKKYIPEDSGKDGMWGMISNYEVRNYALNILTSNSSLIIKGSEEGGMWPHKAYENYCTFVCFVPESIDLNTLKCYIQDEELKLVILALKHYIEEKDDNLENINVNEIAKLIEENYISRELNEVEETSKNKTKILINN